jgi:DNA-binding response OmpR family regulator
MSSAADTPERILIAEPDVLVRHQLAAFLRECGYNVSEACNAEETIVLLEHDALPIDILLAQGEDGFTLATWVREHRPHIEVVLAGSVERATEKAATLCEEGPALRLPYEHKLVLERIRWLTAARARRGGS